MSKKILFRMSILLTVLALVYGMFWFFKVGQVEKQINNFIAANGTNVLISDVSISGFPLTQKIVVNDLKFTIPNLLLNKKQVIIKSVVLTSKVLSSEFTVSFPEAPTLRDIDGNVYNVEFSSDPEIKVSFANGRIAKLSYRDAGYRVVDAQKNTVYAASSSVFNFESNEESDGKIVAKITSDIKDIEGFGAMEVYKNAFEKGLMESIKTGEVVVGNGVKSQDVAATTTPATATIAATVADASKVVVNNATMTDQTSQNATQVAQTSDSSPVAVQNIAAPESVTSVPDSNLIKSNLMLEMQYTLTPVEAKKEEVAVGQLPQIQTSQDRQYNKATKITNLEFSNPLYRVILNGEINNLSDDEMPSGSIAVKVENVSNLVDYVKLAINQMIDPTKKANANAAPDVSATTASTQPAVANDPAQQAAATPNAPASAASPVATPDAATTVASAPATTPAVTAPATEDPYTNFLKRVGTNLSAVAQEIAAKNQVSKDNVAQFDIRREKNLDFLINETSLREILGKM